MSEYQYYEFRAIDRPLSAGERDDLGRISSRAEITATSFTNEYHYGNFRGDPRKLMEQYFDAHLYYANWGNNRLMLRVPLAGLTMADVEPFLADDDRGFGAWDTKQHVIVSWEMLTEGGEYDFDGNPGSLDDLLAVRAELLEGDLRPLYLGWLRVAQQTYEDDEDVAEPPVPPGLKSLSEAQQALAKFVGIDVDLIEAAAERSADARANPARGKELAAWVKALPGAEKDALLMRVLGDDAAVGVELRRRFRDARPAVADTGERRTAGALRRRAEELREERLAGEKRKKERERQAAERRAAEERERRLDLLVGQDQKLWQKAEALVTTKLPRNYDEAVGHLTDLRDLAARAGAGAAFVTRLAAMRERHAAKRTFVERLVKAGLV